MTTCGCHRSSYMSWSTACICFQPDTGANRLTAMISGIVSAYADRILSLDRTGAEWAARLRAYARRSGYSIDLGHVLIAGIARANNLAIATRNVSDFRALGVQIVGPARFRGVGRFCCRCGGSCYEDSAGCVVVGVGEPVGDSS